MLKTFLDRCVGDTGLERLTSKGVARHVRSEVLLDACLACQLLEVAVNECYLTHETFLQKAAFEALIVANKDEGFTRSPFVAR